MMALQLTALFCFMTAFRIGFVDAFRSDYTFVESTHCYYKLYDVRTSWTDAKSKCESEGAVLFHPDNKAELLQVFSALEINVRSSWMLTGISNLRDVNVYETFDGRPVNQVHNTWDSGYPKSRDYWHCAVFSVNNHQLQDIPCSHSYPYPYICKQSTERVDPDVKTVIADASLKIADLERQVTNQSLALAISEQITTNLTVELERLKQLTSNQTAELEVLEKLTSNQTAELEVLEQLTSNQTAELEVLEQLTSNQTAELEVLEQLTSNLTAELEVIKQLTSNQTAELEVLKQQQQQEPDQPSTIANQTVALQQIVDADVNQVAALERLTTNQAAAMQQEKETTRVRVATQPSILELLVTQMKVIANQVTSRDLQTDAMKLLITTQAAAMDRQALLLEKLVHLQGNNDQLHERADQ